MYGESRVKDLRRRRSLRPVRNADIETAYKLASDISDTAQSLKEQGIFHPFTIEIVWQDWTEDIEVSIDVSIRRKEKKVT